MVGHLFRDVVEPSSRVGDRRGYTVPLSIAAHALIIAAVIIVPLVATDSSMLPTPSAMLAFITAAPLPAPPAAPPRVAAAQKPLTSAIRKTAPIDPPTGFTPELRIQANPDPPPEVANGPGVVPGGGVEHSAAPPSPPPAPR